METHKDKQVGLYMNDDEFLKDYEECAECGYDHAYEPQEAYLSHLEKERKELAE